MAALPFGEAAVADDQSKVVKINNAGQSIKVLYDCNSCRNISGLILLGNYLYVVHYNGTILKIQPDTGELFNVYYIPDVSYATYSCSLWFNPAVPNPDILLLAEAVKGEVFSYNLSSGEKQVHVTGLSYPRCASYMFSDSSTGYIVNDYNKKKINIYDASWEIKSTFGGFFASAAVMTSNNSVLVTDFDNNRISEFTTKGVFLHHLLTDISYPFGISYYEPYLWVKHFMLKKFKQGLYRYSLVY